MGNWNTVARDVMKKTTIELTDEQYFFLKEKALELQKQDQKASIVSLLRALVDKDREEWVRKTHRREDNEKPNRNGK